MHSIIRTLIASIALPAVAFAAVDPSPPVAKPEAVLSEVTVVAPRPATPDEIAGNNVHVFVRSHGRPSKRTGQLGRWQNPICPHTTGLAKEFSDFILARIQVIAATLHRESTPDCKANVIIVFTNEPQEFMDVAAKLKPQLLGFHYAAQVPKLKTVNKPVQAWYVTATGNKYGSYIDDAWSQMPSGEPGSRIRTGLQSSIVHVLVVVDAKTISDYTVGSLSDYLAMLILSQTHLSDNCGALPSILDLMAKDCTGEKPDSIAAGDIAYLRALYTINLENTLSLQRASITELMARELKR